ncbi:MAG: hypothetical protein MRZ79_03115 [Bacteroidia bacterium]|nr:hypothetical protein [Bacteroidia bacterium]
MERDLIQQLGEGKTEALERLYHSFFPVLLEKARLLGIPMHEASGTINQIFLEFWNDGGRVAGGLSPLEFFQARLETFSKEYAPSQEEGAKLYESFKAFPQAEQDLVRKSILIDQSLDQAAKDLNLSKSELADCLASILAQLAGSRLNFIPDPKYQQLVLRYQAEDLNLHEENELRHWVDLEDGHSEYFEIMFEMWDGIKSLPEASPPNEVDSWKKLEASLGNTRLGQVKKTSLKRFSLRMALGLLGIVALLVMLGYFVSRGTPTPNDGLPKAGIYLKSSTFALDQKGDFSSLENSSSIVIPSGDSLFVEKNEAGFLFWVKESEISIRTDKEQLTLGPFEEVSYDPTTQKFGKQDHPAP